MTYFDAMLEFFEDFPTITVNLYDPLTQYTSDARALTKYDFDEAVSAHGFQKSAMQNYVRDKVFDNADFILITSTAMNKYKLVNYDSNWYSVSHPDDIGFAGSVYLHGLSRVEKPALLFYLLGDGTYVVGDSTGVVGWRTYGL
jgi:hypothetical protein